MRHNQTVELVAGDGECHAVGGLLLGDQRLKVGDDSVGAGKDIGVVTVHQLVARLSPPVCIPLVAAAGITDQLQRRQQLGLVRGMGCTGDGLGTVRQQDIRICLGIDEQVAGCVHGEEVEEVVGVHLAPVGGCHHRVSLGAGLIVDVGEDAVVDAHEGELVDLVLTGVPAPGAKAAAQRLDALAELGALAFLTPCGQEGQLHEHDIVHAGIHQLLGITLGAAPGIDCDLDVGVLGTELVGQQLGEVENAGGIPQVAGIEEVGDHPVGIGGKIGVDVIVFVEGRQHAGILAGGLFGIGVAVCHRVVMPAVARELGRPAPDGEFHPVLVECIGKHLVAVMDDLPRAAGAPCRHHIGDLNAGKAAGLHHLDVFAQLTVGHGDKIHQQRRCHVADIAAVIVHLPSTNGRLAFGDPRGLSRKFHTKNLRYSKRISISLYQTFRTITSLSHIFGRNINHSPRRGALSFSLYNNCRKPLRKIGSFSSNGA